MTEGDQTRTESNSREREARAIGMVGEGEQIQETWKGEIGRNGQTEMRDRRDILRVR